MCPNLKVCAFLLSGRLKSTAEPSMYQPLQTEWQVPLLRIRPLRTVRLLLAPVQGRPRLRPIRPSLAHTRH
jgi:hypothetical protein